ncbi:MAG: hypothetical protein E7186_04090 [Erysipelotrichaceae bacterium]|nr:hypothetical protein [Erysipelotrichaceae bacterium]
MERSFMKKSFKKWFTILLALTLMVSHLHVTTVFAEDEKPSEFGPVTEVEKQPGLSAPILGELDEEEDIDVVLPYSQNQTVRVSIVLEGNSAIDAGYDVKGIGTNRQAISYRNSLKKQQDKIAAQISSKVLGGKQLNVKWNLTLAANIISAEVPYGKINQIKLLDGVKDVFIENRYEMSQTSGGSSADPNMISSRDMTESNGENSSLYTGAGSKVAIIDSGLDLEHISFAGDALAHSAEEGGFADSLMTEDDLAALRDSLNVPGIYVNEKVPYAYNYVDKNTDVSHIHDHKSEHGSHVAGIAAANRYVKVDGEFVDAAEAKFTVGQAPDAQILVMKVFGVGGGAYDSDYFSAIEDAIVLGADSANLSLGSADPGFIYAPNAYQEILDSLTEKAMVVVFSAGNNSSWDQQATLYSDDINYSAGGSPGTYINTFSVASVDNDGYTGQLLDVGGDKITFNESATYGNAPISSIAGEYEYVYIDGPGMICNPSDVYGDAADADYRYYTARTPLNLFALLPEEVGFEGKIGVCNRGSSSFFAKANGSVIAGGIATIIVNNQPGNMGMNLTGYLATAPAVLVQLDDGHFFKDNATSSGTFTGYELIYDDEGEIDDVAKKEYTYYVGKIGISASIEHQGYNSPNYKMSEFSSWGVPGSLVLKPEITSPGGDIYSANGLHMAEDSDDILGGHEEYELMSGTSMAAPQISGIIAAIGQYYRENDIEGKTGLTLRQYALSVLMSTSEPLKDEEDCYYPVLQQGSGLVNVERAVTAKSFIHMSEEGDDLTAITGAAADYKVKAELGHDPERTGEFEYTFELTNFSENTIKYEFSTDLFTQDIYEEFLAPWTAPVEGEVTYNIVGGAEGHDFDKDGDTDSDDAQAILDYITGLRAEEECDLEAGMMDEDEEITSRDAYLLLAWLEEEHGIGEDFIYLAAGQTATVTVTINVSGSILEERENGGYVEGFTFVKSEDDVQHSIPVLGYYGSWTDPSMYDAVSYVEQAMGSSEKESYWGAENTNGYQLKYADGRNAWFSGNPYIAEPEIDEERFAINSKTVIKNARYTTYRNFVAQIVVIRDADGNIIDKFGFDATPTVGAYYNSQSSTPGWVYTGANVVPVGITAEELGYDEGDKFSIDVYTVPEYFGVIANEGKGNKLTEDQLLEFIENGEVGDGAALGYQFTIDNTAPEISKFEVSEDKTTVTVTAKDDKYIAFIGLMDVQGEIVIVGEVPEQTAPGQEVTVTLDVSGIKNLPNAAALFVGDYARNEQVKLVRFQEGDVITKQTVYMLTDTLNPDSEYIIASTNKAGKTNALYSQGIQYYTLVEETVITDDGENAPYILAEDTDDTFIWYTFENPYGVGFQSKSDGGILVANRLDYPLLNWGDVSYADGFTYSNNILFDMTIDEETGEAVPFGALYFNTYFLFTQTEPGPVYLYEKTELVEAIDPEEVGEITIDPTKTTLIMGVDEERQFNVTIKPVTVEDKSVKWESSDPSIATVDENGLVTAVSVGQVTITATSNQTPEMAAQAVVNVVEASPVNGYINAQVADGDGVYYGAIDLTDMSVYPYAEAEEVYNGGRSGNYVYGINKSNTIHRYDAEEFAIDSEFEVTVDKQYVMIDGAMIPHWVGVSEAGSELDYAYVAAGVSAANKLVFYTNTGNLWYLDTDIEDIVAMALIGYDLEDPTDPEFDYALLTADGSLYLYYVYGIEVDSGIDVDGGSMLLGKVNGITISDDLTAYTMTCSTGHIFDEEGNPDFDDWGLFIGDNTSKGIYYVDIMSVYFNGEADAQFIGVVDGATNLSSLFNDGYDALVYEDIAPETGSGKVKEIIGTDKLETKFHAQFVQLVEPAAAVEESEEAANEVTGTANAVKGFTSNPVRINREEGEPATDEPVADEPAEEENADTFEVVLTAKDLSHNGLYRITYDPEKLEYVETRTELEYTSVNDLEEGMIKIAFADLEGVEEGDTIATIIFKKGCDDATVKIETLESNDEVGEEAVIATEETEAEGVGHEWGEPEWTWNDDHSEATAKFTCKHDEDHVEEVTEKSEITEEVPAEVGKEGKRVYKVTVTGPDGKEYSTEYEEVIPALPEPAPETGDALNITAWTIAFLGSMSALAYVFFTMKKKGYFQK